MKRAEFDEQLQLLGREADQLIALIPSSHVRELALAVVKRIATILLALYVRGPTA